MPVDAQTYRELVQDVAAMLARQPASAWFFTGEDRIRLTTFGSLAGVTVAVEGRMMDLTGHPRGFAEPHTPNSDRTAATTTFAIGEGFLLNVHVRASAGTPRIGQVYAILEVIRGDASNVNRLGVIWAGYITDTSRFGYPGSPIRSSIEGPGVIRSITGTNPAAGVEISETVPANARWELLSLRATFVASATAATRVPQLVLDDGTSEYHRTAGQNITASQTADFCWADLGARVGMTNPLFVLECTGAGLVLMGGHRIRTVTASLQAGDDWSAPQLLIEEWIED